MARRQQEATVMPFDPGLLGGLALVLAPLAPAAHASANMGRLCGGGFAPFPFPDGAPPRRDDCNMACHALCRSGRSISEDGADEDE